MRFGLAGGNSKNDASESRAQKRHVTTLHTAERRLVEEYWRSVLVSKGEPPLYHTFSDRYGGTQGIPFAARTDCSAVIRVPGKRGPSERDIGACIASGYAALGDGELKTAENFFQEGLTLLQNLRGGLTVEELVQCHREPLKATEVSRREKKELQGFLIPLSNVLRGLGEVAILSREYEKAIHVLNLSCRAHSLQPETYLLRASCYERLGEPKMAYEEYEKYLKLNTPSLDVLAHCGKCAAEAGIMDAAESRIRELLNISEELEEEKLHDGCQKVESYLYLFQKVSLYIAHANFYLGYIRVKKARTLSSASGFRAFFDDARPYFEKAVSNTDYVGFYERNVELAIEHKEFEVAKELLCHLQLMRPGFAEYYTRMADICRMTIDVPGEIKALSEALDRQQTFSEQRRTRLSRGCIFYETAEYNSAILDFSIVISLPSDEGKDQLTPIAFLKRAEAYQQRQRLAKYPVEAREDQEAALSDYSQFLNAVEALDSASLSSLPVGRVEAVCGDKSNEHEEYRTVVRSSSASTEKTERGERVRRDFVCDPSSVTSAMLVLANGAFQRGNFIEAIKFFSSAIARGWEPVRPSAKSTRLTTGVSRGVSPLSTHHISPLNVFEEYLFDQMFISLAHTVIEKNPIHDDMFKIAYETRDWVVTQDVKKGKSSERKDQEKPIFAFPSLSYATVDSRYMALRALEPTMFSALEEQFLELWEPYHTEVERTREDVMSARGKRGKRHGGGVG